MVLAVVFVVAQVSPLINLIGHGFNTSWAVFILWAMAMLVENRRNWRSTLLEVSHRRAELFGLVGWCLVVLLNFALGRGYTGQRHAILALDLAMIVAVELVYTARGNSSGKAIVTVVMAILGLEALRSIPALWAQPALVRDATAFTGGLAWSDYIASVSVGEYGLYTAYAIAMPVLLAVALDQRGAIRILLLGLCGAIAFAIFIATLLGAILLMTTGFCLLVLLTPRHKQYRLRTLSFLIILGVIGLSIWSSVVKDTVQGEMVADKLVQQALSISDYGLMEGDITSRTELAQNSIETFRANPVFGVGAVTGALNPYIGPVVGGHSSWSDVPAEYGLVGFLFYAVFLVSVMKRAWLSYKFDTTSMIAVARVISCFTFVLGGLYNPVVFVTQIETMFFFVVMVGAEAQPALKLLAPIVSERPASKFGSSRKRISGRIWSQD